MQIYHFPRIPQTKRLRKRMQSFSMSGLPRVISVVNVPYLDYWANICAVNRWRTVTTPIGVIPIGTQRYRRQMVESLRNHLTWRRLPGTSPRRAQQGDRGWQGKYVGKEDHQ